MGQDDELPRHVAIIMDGNGRWARNRHLPRYKGHEAGAKAVREIVEECARNDLGQLTLYVLSAENFGRRPPDEVSFLMELLKESLRRETPSILNNNIRFAVIGRLEELPGDVVEQVENVIQASASNTGMILCLALNYGSRAEIVDAARKLAADVMSGTVSPEGVDEETFERYLYTVGMPDPDLIIRTAAEMRMSNFLLWQGHYAELWITPALWPDFRKEHLHQAFEEYRKRVRKFGGLVTG